MKNNKKQTPFRNHKNMEDNIYQIPECNHKFHSECVITWFRMGKSKCPYCNTEFAHKKKSTPPRLLDRI